ncbi:hypothetical protein [Candidatus Oscillochloris fontis]|uniref:hypothetical protein n=1 Tax=Candidatus Oscillochloris fontis TaxID=2496868 RepID=UPI00101BACCA|nr:hypothetical protein [Candidatus Oscillochloris fontis]
MSKTLRLIHRWLAPVFIVVMIAVISTQGNAVGLILQRIQQVMVVIFALTGLYLFTYPLWVKSRRAKQRVNAARQARS